MNPVDKEREEIEATAAEWLARRDRRFTAEEAVMFARWKMADARHAEAVAELELVWGALDGLSAEISQQRAGGVTATPPATISEFAAEEAEPRRRGGLAQWWPALGLAAVFALVAGGLFWRGAFSVAETAVRYETVMGMQRTVELSDGTVLQLNTDTALVVQFGRKSRQVTLERGEAFFRVAKEPERPFVVLARGAEARVLGTAFAARVWEHTREIEVLVAEGRVSFGPSGAANPTLTRGQQGVLTWAGSGAPRIGTLDDKMLTWRLSWQTGRLEFTEMPLATVVAELNRYQRQQLVLGDATIADELVGGSIKIGNVESFVRLLDASFSIGVRERDGDKIVLAQRP